MPWGSLSDHYFHDIITIQEDISSYCCIIIKNHLFYVLKSPRRGISHIKDLKPAVLFICSKDPSFVFKKIAQDLHNPAPSHVFLHRQLLGKNTQKELTTTTMKRKASQDTNAGTGLCWYNIRPAVTTESEFSMLTLKYFRLNQAFIQCRSSPSLWLAPKQAGPHQLLPQLPKSPQAWPQWHQKTRFCSGKVELTFHPAAVARVSLAAFEKMNSLVTFGTSIKLKKIVFDSLHTIFNTTLDPTAVPK